MKIPAWAGARAAVLFAAALLAACGGGGDAASIPRVYEQWHFELITTGADPNASEVAVLPEKVLFGAPLENLYPDELNALAPLYQTSNPDLYVLIRPSGHFPNWYGDVHANDTGQTFWATAVAPVGDPWTPHSRIGLNTDLEVARVLKKTADGASIKAVFTEASLDAIDGNPTEPTGPECPWKLSTEDPAERCEETISASIEATVEAYAVLPNGGQLHLRSAGFTARLNGWRGHWHFNAAPSAGSELHTAGSDSFYEERDFQSGPDTQGQFARYALIHPITIDVPTDTVALGQDIIVVTRVRTSTFNRRQLESYAGAFLKDPASGPGTGLDSIRFDEQGVELVRVEVPQPAPAAPAAPPPRPPAADCSGPADPAAGTLQLSAPTLDGYEQAQARALVRVQRSGGSRGAASVRLATRDGSALAGTDYTAQDLVVRFDDGEQGERIVALPLLDNALADGDRTLTLELSDLRGCATLGANRSATLTIHDDDTRGVSTAPLHVGGSVSGLVGSGLVIREVFSGATVSPTADGPFTLPATWLPGTLYDVRVQVQPNAPAQSCTVARGSGTVGAADVGDVAVTCTVLAASGSLDGGFGTGGKVDNALSAARAIALQGDGRLLVLGGMTLSRYEADGRPDASFGSGGSVRLVANGGGFDALVALALQADGRIVVAGYTAIGSGFDDMVVMRLNADGSLDAGFGSGGKVVVDYAGSTDRALALAIQGDGRIVAAGLATRGSGASVDQDVALLRLNADGSLDTGFGSGGKVTTNVAGTVDEAHAVALQADGRIVVAGRVAASGGADPDVGVLRYLADGRLDASFGSGGIVRLDLTGTGAWDEAADLAVQPDGRIVVAGQAFVGASMRYALLRLNTDGSPDTGFGAGHSGIVTSAFSTGSDIGRGLALQGDGRIVVAGQVASLTNGDVGVARYLVDGSPDTAFGSNGLVRVDFYGAIDGAYDVLLQPDGRIVAAGSARNGATTGIGLVRIVP